MSETIPLIETPWPDVWVQYWRKLNDDEVIALENSLTEIFTGANNLQKGEIATALRRLGETGMFTAYQPKVGVISAKIKERRRGESQTEQAAKNSYSRRGEYTCGYCKDSGWFNVPYVWTIEKDHSVKRFPKLETSIVPIGWAGKDDKHVRCYRIVHLELYNAFACPCTFCNKYAAQITGDSQKIRDLQHRVKHWMLTLPDQCIDKLDILRSNPLRAEEIIQELESCKIIAVPKTADVADLDGWVTDEFTQGDEKQNELGLQSN